jgi:hypothetical protein
VREQLFKVVDKWLAIRDKQAIDIILSVAVHASMPGDPLWLLVVNVPGTAKTELLRSFNKAKYKGQDLVYTIDSLTPYTLISGLMTKDDTDPSLLGKINDKLLIIKDFSEILSSNWGEQKKIYADLRQAYDGYLEKPFGSGAYKRGGYAHFGLIAAATPIIDTFNILTQQLGERFLRLRLKIDEDEAVSKACEVAGHEKAMRTELNNAFTSVLEHYVSTLDIAKVLQLPVPDDKLQALAKLMAMLRTEVIRDRNRMVKIKPEPEVGTRLVKQLKALYRMSYVVLGQGDYSMVLRVATDCIPSYRLLILKELKDGTGKTIQDISNLTKIPNRTCDERLEDMELVGALESVGNPTKYSLSGKTQLLIMEAEF